MKKQNKIGDATLISFSLKKFSLNKSTVPRREIESESTERRFGKKQGSKEQECFLFL